MASPIAAQLILCDHAVTEPSGKVHMLGAGWSVTGTPTAPQAVVVMLKIPWDRTNQRITLRLQLMDSDGRIVRLDGPEGQQAIEMEHEIEAGRPAGLAPGSMIDASFALNVQPMPLPPGRYEWRLHYDDVDVVSSFQVIDRSP